LAGGRRELAIVRLVGLFDRPRPRRPWLPCGPDRRSGIDRALVDLSEEEWQWVVSSLREHGFLLPADPQQPGVLDAHPLVRVYFQEELEKERPEAWQEGNLRLYEHLKKAAPELPETLEAMEPLFTAVVHGCRAGRHQEALYEVFQRRINREDEAFGWRKLGALARS